MADDAPPGGDPSVPTLEDGVIRLRPLTLADADAWLEGEDDVIRRWFQFPRPSTRADVSAAIESWARSWREGGRVRHFGIEAGASPTLVGGVEVRDRGEGSAYVSYLIFAPHRRRGHGSRAVRLAALHALQDTPVTRLVIIVDEDNQASRAVAEAAGFRLEGLAEAWEHVELGSMLRYVRP
ncbi:MAG: GNAT family N-acetyltransferase [Myxococcales bacterium]|nr:GNAT family N-acetyltransferase [Myxococcales bacterium]MCB9712915.1 GNAT family N-acetyltransferase [Myxococcales bacterium]